MKRRVISAALAAAMLSGVIPSAPVLAEDEPIILGTQRSEAADYDENYAYVMMGTVQSEVDERGRYVLTLYREGNTDIEASVVLKTADVSAKYGVDYIIDDGSFQTQEEETDGTLMELSADDENAEAGEAALEEMNQMVSESVDAEEETEPEEEDDTEKSSLAKLKEEQTGEKTRPTYESEMQPITGLVGGNMGPDISEYIETSSSTPIVFESGETEKQVIIKILEDDESEGQEIASFMVSEPGDGTSLAEPMTTSIIINDDEPVVHSILSFSAPEYNAEDGKAEITVRREEALYSYVTAKVRTVEDGDAKSGVNFSAADAEIALRPYQEETTFEIPAAADKNMSFGIELYDLKGGENGEYMSARVNITASGSSEELMTLASDDDDNYVNINDKKYKLERTGNKADIIDDSVDPKVKVGDYIYPTTDNISYGWKGAETEGKYMETIKNEYDPAGFGWLKCDEWRWRLGWEYAIFYFHPKRYKSVWLNYETFSDKNYDLLWCGYKVRYVNGYTKDYHVTGKTAQSFKGPVVLVDGGENPQSDWSRERMDIYARRKDTCPGPPEMKFYGIALMYREFKIKMKQPAEMNYRTATKTEPLQPATWQANRSTVYMDQTVSFDERSASSDGIIRGAFKGFNIKAGKNGTPFFYPTTERKLVFNESFVELIDRNTKGTTVSEKDFYTELEITPVYEYIPVKVEILPTDGGHFTDPDLQKSTTLHVGDTVSMAAEPAGKGGVYETYYEEEYRNPGDTDIYFGGYVLKNSYGGTLTLRSRRYVLRPNFTDKANRIEIQMDEEAQKYFEVTNLVPAEKLSAEDTGKMILNTSPDYPYTQVVPGKAYKVELTEKAECKGKFRPKIVRTDTGDYVNGFVMDFIAKPMREQNIITITAEKVPSYTRGYTFTAAVNYSSVDLRGGSELTTEPAIGASVTVGASLSELYDIGKTKHKALNRYTAEVGADGTAELIIEKAVANDRLSVLVTNNDVDQVYYIKVNSSEGYSTITKTYDRLVADDATKTNKYESVTGQFIGCSVKPVTMPINTPYAPYVGSVTYTSAKKADMDTRNNMIEIVEDDMITLKAYVNTNGQEIERVEFIRLKDGVRQETCAAEQDKDNSSIYKAQMSSDARFDGDKIYVRIVTKGTVLNEKHEWISVEKQYPMVNTGLYFGQKDHPAPESQHLQIKTDTMGKLPILGDMAADVDTGKLKWETDYVDPMNPGISDRKERIIISISKSDAEKTLKKLDSIQHGETKQATKSVEDQLKDFDPFAEASEQDVKLLAREFGEGKTDEERENTVKSWTESQKQAKRKEFEDKQKKDSLAKLGEADWDFKLTVLMQFEYVYDKESSSHKFSGGAFLIGGTFNIKKTWYWIVYGVPVYLNVSGYASLQMDGAYKAGDDVDEKDIKEQVNLAEAPLESNNLWRQIGLGGKLQPGIGICGIVGVRGVFKVDGIVRSLYTPDIIALAMNCGAMITMSGGVGVDLLLFSFDYTLGSKKYAWGIYDKKKSMSLASEDEVQISIRPLERGKETGGESDISLASSLSPVNKHDIVTGAMEYVRPEIIDIGGGRLMMVYLRNDADRKNGANAASLVYRIKDGSSWSEPVYVNDDGTADAGAAVLCDGDKVYIAWSSADEAVDADGSNISEVKEALGMMNIRMAVYDIASGTMSDAITVTDDAYLNSDVRLAKENGNIALYYLKKDLSSAENAEQLISTTSNYSTWAKRVYDTAQGEFVKLEAETGGEVDEKLISVKHPTVSDPLVYDYAVADFTYTAETEDTSDDVNYIITTYSVDSDGNISTNEDRELWMQITDITNGISYYPIRPKADAKGIINPRLTKTEGDVLLTWLSDRCTFNTVSIKNIFDGLLHQNGSSSETADTGINGYMLMRELTSAEAAQPDWGTVLAEKAKTYMSTDDIEYFDELFSSISAIENGEIASNPKSFGTDSAEFDMSDYQIVIGEDKNAYLFWTGASAEPDNYGKELYASAYYSVSEEWQEAWGSEVVNHGWSEPVQLTEYGEVIDEMTIAVDENKNAVIIANMYEQTIDEDGNVCQGIHKLSEIDCVPTNSLDIKDDEIVFEDDYPTEGEQCDISISVKNNGLLASTGQTVSISVLQNGDLVFNDANVEEGETEAIYPGTSFTYTSDKWIPDSLDGDIEIVAEVKEKDTGETHTARRKLTKAPNIEFGESYAVKAADAVGEWAQYDDETAMSDEAKAIDAIINDENAGDFDYVVFIPVSNTGNMPMSDITASAVHIDSDYNKGDTLGKSYAVSLGAKETGLLAIPVKAEEKHYARYGLLELMLTAESGNERLDAGDMHQTIHESENVGLVINDGERKQSMKAGETLALSVRTYPYDGQKNLYYFSDNPEAADVDEEGTVTAISKGTAGIYVIDLDSYISSVLEVSVDGAEPTVKPTAAPTSKPISRPSGGGTGSTIAGTSAFPAAVPQTSAVSGAAGRFTDVAADAWYYATVESAFAKGIMTGIDDTHFAPEQEITRGMFATALYRMEKEPETNGAYTFKDVAEDAYYAKAVAWASANGIVEGYSDAEFAPDDKITREQMSAMLYRYAKLHGKGFTGTWMFPLSYEDSAEVSEYAYESLCWNTMNGVINGTDGNRLEPKANTTRAQAAAVLIRLEGIL